MNPWGNSAVVSGRTQYARGRALFFRREDRPGSAKSSEIDEPATTRAAPAPGQAGCGPGRDQNLGMDGAVPMTGQLPRSNRVRADTRLLDSPGER